MGTALATRAGAQGWQRWRNSIITVLIERPEMKRCAIHSALYEYADPKLAAEVDQALQKLVAAGDIERVVKGVYRLARPAA